MTTYDGIDLAWGECDNTGLAAVDPDGRLLDLANARTDDDLESWSGPYDAGQGLVAIDSGLTAR